MRRMKDGLFQAAIIIGLGGVLAAPVFAEIPDFKEVDPIAHTTYGHGYDTTRRVAFSKGGGCVTVDRSKTYSQGQTSSKSGFERVTSTSEIAEEMGLSVSASISAVSPSGKFSASDKADVASGTNSSQFNETILAYSFTRLKPTYLDPTYIRLKQKYIDMLKDPKQGIGAFKAECGDTFIYGIQEGREFYGTAYITKQTLEQWTKFSVEGTASYEGATVEADAAADYAKAMNQSFGSNSIKINVSRSETGLSNPSSVEQMVSQFQGYNVGSSGGTNAVKYILSSYANADGYPIEDPLSPPSNDEKLGYMVSALWDLKALQQDASFVEGSPEMFAMGTTPKKRKARKAAITKARKAWRSEFDSLRAQAIKCVDDFTDACETLARKYRDRDPLTERSIMPTRYTSDCGQTMQIVDIGGRKILGYSMPRSSVRGDTEMASGPVKVRTWLKLYKDGSQLKALHKTNAYE